MSKKKWDRSGKRPRAVKALDLSAALSETADADAGKTVRAGRPSRFARYRLPLGAVAICLLIGLGVMASNGWLPHTDPLSGKRTGWFGGELPKNAPSSWNPFAAPPPSPTPQLSKEYVYAGSRLVAAVDANANEIPPADLAVWRPSTGTWWVLGGPGSAQTQYQWGSSGDKVAPGDYDGDGKTDFCVYRQSNGTWYIVNSSTGSAQYPVFGGSSDVPAPGDYDGDGKTDLALWRNSNATWYFTLSGGGTPSAAFGSSGDVPVPADYDGDGKTDIAVRRDTNATFYYISSITGGYPTIVHGATCTPPTNCDTSVPGDYDGDGKADAAVWRASNGTWYIKRSSDAGTTTLAYGQSGDVPVQNDYDGDAKVDIAVFRPASSAVWYIRKTSTGTDRTEYWGTTGDIPVPAYYRR